MERRHTYSVILLGDYGVGKSTLFANLSDNSKCVVDECTKTYDFENNIVKLVVRDTGGTEQYRSITPSYYRRANIAVCMYDENQPLSKTRLSEWIEHAESTARNPIIVILANDRVKKEKEAEEDNRLKKNSDIGQFAKQIGAKLYYTVSAASKEDVEEVFRNIAEKVYRKTELGLSISCKSEESFKDKEASLMLSKTAESDSKKRRCCMER